MTDSYDQEILHDSDSLVFERWTRARRRRVRKMLLEELLERYETSAREGPGPMDFTCRRCLKRCGEDEGSDFLAGLCDGCKNDVEEKFCTIAGQSIRGWVEQKDNDKIAAAKVSIRYE
jgi:hypothetical protein